MAPRPAARRERNNDYSAVGTAGRRTGVTLPHGKLDENGLEEITGLFSSPKKSLPEKQNAGANTADGQNSSGLTPTQTLSTRRSLGGPALPPPRSVSPRKSGIGGSARRSTGLNIGSPSKALEPVDVEDGENDPTPTRVKPRRFLPSPEKRALQEVIPNGPAVSSGQVGGVQTSLDQNISIEAQPKRAEPGFEGARPIINEREVSEPIRNPIPDDSVVDEESIQNPMGDEEEELQEVLSILNTVTDDSPAAAPREMIVEKPLDQVLDSIEPVQHSKPRQQQQQPPPPLPPPATQRRNGHKRKSGDLSEENGASSSAGPAKKPRASKGQSAKAKGKQKMGPAVGREFVTNAVAVQEPLNTAQARMPGLEKDPNTHLSHRQQAQLDQIIEKVRARPGKLKTLYVLKREKCKTIGADDVRSGRAVVKPLAYWSAEQCVNDDGTVGLEPGSRIPLSSIKEITPANNSNDNNKSTNSNDDNDTTSLSNHDPDGHEQGWETEIGVYRGQANIWSQADQQALPPPETEQVDLAYHPSSILTRQAGTGTGASTAFKYAKLISMPFFGSGVVDLPVGTVKRPKNSKSMQMCFFVFKGRVTVRLGLGIEEGDCEEFSVGKGGVFQIPRGNRYSIENELGKPARLFFSQACETVSEA